ncbi:MAG: phosphodiester glycosidase family protein, partial [Clostridia bacterium]|nr:phosphodiester glycosidase family protein [Clostridia bacterium]
TAPPETTTAATAPAETTSVSSPAQGKQDYREYNGREFASNETFVGEYKTDRVSIGVSHVKDGDLSYFICDIKITSPSDFHTALANNRMSGRAYTSRIAASVGAGFAVNGDFCGYRTYGVIIREGALYRNKKADGWDMCYLNKYGDLILCNNDKQDGKRLLEEGVLQSWCFGPKLVEDYRALTVDEFNTPDLSRRAKEPRTAIGQIDELHYIFLVVDAIREKKGIGDWNTIGGMTFAELAQTFASLGCKTAYNLDGGGSTSLWLNGKLANSPSGGGEREVSDIIYFK